MKTLTSLREVATTKVQDLFSVHLTSQSFSEIS